MPGDCHYLEGNLNARRRIETIKKWLGQIGLEAERAEMFNTSSAMGPQFARIVAELTERIQKLGPSPLKGRRMKDEG